jgi:1,4-alpha-glucan branching enzyme
MPVLLPLNRVEVKRMAQFKREFRDLVGRVHYHVKQLFNPVAPAEMPGMGSIPGDNETLFRVWAPHAEHVFVVGTFNRWLPWQSPLAPEKDGYWSAVIPRAQSGDEYKYLIHHNSHSYLRPDPYGRTLTLPHQNTIIGCEPFDWLSPENGSAFMMPALEELVIYELHVGTFTTNGDGGVGTFAGMIEKLPYLQALGINAIELMPVKAFPGDYSWGYNPAHPFAITQTYGGRIALQQLVEAAHAHGIAVIVDVVYNHFGPQELSLWQFDGWQEHGRGGIYFYNDWRAKTPWAHTRPDYGRLPVRQFIRDNVFMWLEEFRVDGLRWDATNFIRNVQGHDADVGANIAEGWQMMQQINQEMKQCYPAKITIAEDLQGNAWITRTAAEQGAAFTAQWDSHFVHPIRQAVITSHDENRDMLAVSSALSFRYNHNVFERVIYTESHDEVANGKARVPEEISPGQSDNAFAAKRAALGAALVFSAPGIPMIFQGQEFLERGWFDDHVPLDWEKAGANQGIISLYRDLIALRRNIQGKTRGLTGQHINVFHLNNDDKLIAFHRWYAGGPGDDVVVIANFANRTHEGYSLGLPRPGLWQVRFNSDQTGYGAAFGGHHCPPIIAARMKSGREPIDGMSCWGNITIAPYSVLILSQGE